MKNGEKEYIELVRKAQLGNEESRNRLAEITRGRLRMYVYRLTLDNDWTEDILQESMLEMFKFLDKLKSPDRLWGWLLRIASNNVRDDYNRRRRRSMADAEPGGFGPRERQEGLENLVSEEVKQVVSAAMLALKPRHRMVLALRCYEEMPFSRISEVMGCGQFGARMLFGRAKKALARQLSRRGLTRGSLLMALALFGKMTATTKAAAANISVTAATVKIGAAASLAAMVTSKTAIVTMTAAAIVTAGTVGGPSVVESGGGRGKTGADGSLVVQGQAAKNAGVEESWYYYPAGPGGAVMMRLAEYNGQREDSRFRILQNQHGNYRYENGVIYLNNFRSYNPDLSVRRLPTDDKALSAFISQVEGERGDMEYVSAAGRGLLVICKRDKGLGDRIWRVDRHSNVLDEVFFQLDWPEGTQVVDRRDAMHERGWTYFRVSGQVNGEQIKGAGRIPFVYEMTKTHYPWVDIEVGERLRIVDSGQQVHIYDASGKVIGSYPGGSFFDCLGSPWMGLHTIDTVRRAAARQRIPFETKLAEQGKAEITLTGQKTRLLYEIDLNRDFVETIKVYRAGGVESDVMVSLRFDYLDEIPPDETGFRVPIPRTSSGPSREGLGVMWPAGMLEGGR
jgi:RNA polymerase sigma factor (sigma-70 family)